MRTFLAQYFATVFTLVRRDQGGEDAPTEQEVEDSVTDLVAAAHTLRSALSQIANQATDPLKSALNQLRSGTDSWPSAFATGDATAIEAAYGNPTVMSAIDAITPVCGWEV